MATTTNFGWTTPDNTDAVTNGALAIRTLGSEIDTTMNGAVQGTMNTKNAQVFFPAPVIAAGTAARSDTANSVLLVPFVPAYSMTLTSVSVRVETSASASCYLGIYADNAGVPGTLITDFGSVSTSTTGIKTIAISQAVTAGTVYWLAVKPNSTSTRFTSATYNTNLFAAIFSSIGTILNSTLNPYGIEASNGSSGALGALSGADVDSDAGVMIVLEA